MSEEIEFLFTDDGIASSCFNWRVIVAVPCAAVASYAAMAAVKYLSALRKQPLPSEPLSAFANEALQILTVRNRRAYCFQGVFCNSALFPALAFRHGQHANTTLKT